jgi:hypothetical protein
MNSVALSLRLLQFWRVSKSALGKGLADWLKNRPVGEPISGGDSTPPAPITPGVGVLLRGKNGDAEKTQAQFPEAPTKQFWPYIRWVLGATDLVLIGFCALLTLSRRHPLGFLEVTLCVVAIGLGAALAVIALLGSDLEGPKRGK